MLFIHSTDVLLSNEEALNSNIRSFSNQLTLAENQLLKFYQYISSQDFPFINQGNVEQLELVKRTADVDDAETQEILHSLQSDVNDLPKLVTASIDKMGDGVTDVIDHIVRPVEELVQEFVYLRRNLAKFEASTEINNDFLM